MIQCISDCANAGNAILPYMNYLIITLIDTGVHMNTGTIEIPEPAVLNTMLRLISLANCEIFIGPF